MFSNMLTIMITRSRVPFWRGHPSKQVTVITGANCVGTVVISLLGLGINAISPLLILGSFALVTVTGIALTGIRTLDVHWRQRHIVT